MCNYKFKLSTMMPYDLFYNLNQMNKSNNTISINPPKKPHSLKTPSNLHPKAHDTHFPLHSPKRSSPKKAYKKPISSPRLIPSTCKFSQSKMQSCAMVKKSSDPKKEFRESMREVIAENNLMTLKDLEELLECYLCLNSKEYHGVIVEVFAEIWFDVSESD